MAKIKSIYLSSFGIVVAGVLLSAWCTMAAGNGEGFMASGAASGGYLLAVLVASGLLVQRVRSLRLAPRDAAWSAKSERTLAGLAGAVCALATVGYVITAFTAVPGFEKLVAGFSSLFFLAGTAVFFARERSLAWAPAPATPLRKETPAAPAPVTPAARVVPRPAPVVEPEPAPAPEPVEAEAPPFELEPPPVAPAPKPVVLAPPPPPLPIPRKEVPPPVVEAPKPVPVPEPAPVVPEPEPVAPVVVEAPVAPTPAPEPEPEAEHDPFAEFELEPARTPPAPEPVVVAPPEPVVVAAPVVEAPVAPAPVVEPEPAPAVVAEAPPAAAPYRIPMPEDDFSFDEEIREIFIEEAQEVMETIHEHFPVWAANFARHEALTEFRRGFHTLKGSGRMVGARALAELAWNIESMLNKVRDKVVQPNKAMAVLITETLELIPDLIDDFANSKPARFNTSGLMTVAEAMTRGESVSISDVEAAAKEARQAELA